MTKVMSFDIANEIKIDLLAKFECLQRQFIAFVVLSAVAENTNAGLLVTKNFAGINAAHHRVMEKMDRTALDIGAGIDQHEFILLRWNDSGNSRTIHAR